MFWGEWGQLQALIASSVQKSKANSETERHNRELEQQLRSGTGYEKFIKHYNKMVGKGYSREEIVKSLNSKFGSGVVSDFLSKIPLLGNLISGFKGKGLRL